MAIDLETVVAAAKAIAAEYPDRRNPHNDTAMCQYVEEDGSPSCIIGHIAFRLGWPLPAYGSRQNRSGVFGAGFDNGRGASPALLFLGDVQNRADDDKTWREAVSVALDLWDLA